MLRTATVQWEQRPFPTAAAFLQKLGATLDELAARKVDIALFPEHLSWSIATARAFREPGEAIRHLATYSTEVLAFSDAFSQKRGLRVVLGTLPVVDGGRLMARCFFLQPGTAPVFYDKTHLTPWEKQAGCSPGDVLKIWETPFGKIAPLVCYDIEFPEAARVVARAGAKVIFVPYQTDAEHGHWRIRHCAQARAIENEVFVATAGNVGGDPESAVMDTNWASSAILSPSDVFFKKGGVVGKLPANRPGILVEDLDLRLLEKQHRFGTVRTVADQRPLLITDDGLLMTAVPTSAMPAVTSHP